MARCSAAGSAWMRWSCCAIFGCGPRLPADRLRAEQVFHAGIQRLRGLRERLHGDARDAALVVGQRLLGDALNVQSVGSGLCIGLAALGDAMAEGGVERALLTADAVDMAEMAVRTAMSMQLLSPIQLQWLHDPQNLTPICATKRARLGKHGSESSFLILDKHKARIAAGLVVCGVAVRGY